VGYFCNFQNLPEVSYRSMSENSPNLVTLMTINNAWLSST
jgi:hypothetical protein